MGRKLTYTPSSRIKNDMRRMWLRSRERAAALKREGYRCQSCGIKQSRAKGKVELIEVHHKAGAIAWAEIEAAIRMWLLVDPEDLECLCPKCHDKRHENI